jgi:arsenate reductase (thioredoxin)
MSTHQSTVLRAATDEDLQAVVLLLRAADLPTDGVEGLVRDLVVGVAPDGLVAAGALERYGHHALLRSVVVSPSERGRGLGRRVVEDRLRHAASTGMASVYLLTTTAETFFAELGFEPVDREEVPDAVRRSREFVSLCPASAVAMHRVVVRPSRPAVLFLCTHNAGRSQMAAGWLRHYAADRVAVYSGGSEPAERVNPGAVVSMAEVGIDIAGEQPKPWTAAELEAADVVVTMGCGDACPVLPGRRYLDWPIEDPAGRPVEAIRPIRDEIGRRVRGLVGELGLGDGNT